MKSFNLETLVKRLHSIFLILGDSAEIRSVMNKVENISPPLAWFVRWRLIVSVISAILHVDIFYHDYRSYPPITDQLNDPEVLTTAIRKNVSFVENHE